MEIKDIDSFVLEQVNSGVSKKDIDTKLLAVGWKEDDINKAYAKALVENGVPIPENGAKISYAKKSSTVEVIINFFSFILLGIIVSALITLYFAVINKLFPDALDSAYSSYYYRRVSDTIHYSISALVVGFPMYFIAMKLWFKRFRQDETKIESKLTKWVTYLVLLVSSVSIVGDLIYMVYNFLQGEISMRFFLKAIIVLVVAGMVFGFYYFERRKIQYKKDVPRSLFKKFGYALTAFVLVGVVSGFIIAGSPSTERKRAFDEARSRDLSELASCIKEYAIDFNKLPVSIDDFNSTDLSYCAGKRDPETKEAYEYRVISELKNVGFSRMEGEVELCATFSLPSEESNNKNSDYYMRKYNSKWYKHGKGRDCDTEKITVKVNNFQTQ